MKHAKNARKVMVDTKVWPLYHSRAIETQGNIIAKMARGIERKLQSRDACAAFGVPRNDLYEDCLACKQARRKILITVS